MARPRAVHRALVDLSTEERQRLETALLDGESRYGLARLHRLAPCTITRLATALGLPRVGGIRHWRSYRIVTVRLPRPCELCGQTIARGDRARRCTDILAHVACVDALPPDHVRPAGPRQRLWADLHALGYSVERIARWAGRDPGLVAAAVRGAA